MSMAVERSVLLLGIPFVPLTKAQARDRIARLCQARLAASVTTPNPEILLRATRDPALRHALLRSELRLPDGIGLLLAARLRGARLPERITGIDTAEWLLSYAAKQGLRVFLLGGKPSVAEAAMAALTARFSGLTVCGTHHGYFSADEQEALLSEIIRAKPDLLFLCLGSPKQELFGAEFARRIPTLRLCMGLGGALDVWSGQKKRAPRAWQALGLEWLWRMLQEPSRLRRLPALAAFFLAVVQKEKQQR